MSKINHEIKLLHDFCWRYKEKIKELSPQQRKMFFAVFTLLDSEKKYESGQIVYMSREVMIAFLQCKSDCKIEKLDERVRIGFREIEKLFALKDLPYTYFGRDKGHYCFLLRNCRIFSQIGEKLHCTFDLDEISSYQDGSNKDNNTVPILWYLQCIIVKFLFDYQEAYKNSAYPFAEIEHDENGNPVKMAIIFDHAKVKKVMNFKKFGYVNIPQSYNELTGKKESSREFFEDYNAYWGATAKLRNILDKVPEEGDDHAVEEKEWAMKKLRKAQIELEKKYHKPISELEKLENELYKKKQNCFQDFIDKVLKAGVEEINSGSMIHLLRVSQNRRSTPRTKDEIAAGVPKRKARTEETLILNNYEMNETDRVECEVLLYDENNNLVGSETSFKEICNYRKRKQYGEYSVFVDLRFWFEANTDPQEDVIQPTNSAKQKKVIDQPIEDELPFTAGNTYEEEELPFTVGKPYDSSEQEDLSWMLDDSDDLPFN